MKTFYIRSIISTHMYTYIKENCKIIMNIKNKMSVVEKKRSANSNSDVEVKSAYVPSSLSGQRSFVSLA